MGKIQPPNGFLISARKVSGPCRRSPPASSWPCTGAYRWYRVSLPWDEGKNGLTELFPLFCQGIFNPWRYLRKWFAVDQVFFFEIFYHIGKGLGTDPVKLLHTILEPYLLKVTDDTDDQDSPFLCNDIDKNPWVDLSPHSPWTSS